MVGILLIGCGFLFTVWDTAKVESRSDWRQTIFAPVLLILAIIVLQQLPLPLGVLQLLSPPTAELTMALSPVVQRLGGGSLRFAPISAHPPATLLLATTLLGCLLIFVSMVRLTHRLGARSWLLTLPLLATGLIEAGLGLKQAADWTGPAFAFGTFLNRNHLAGFLEMVLPFAVMACYALVQKAKLTVLVRVSCGVASASLVFLLLAANLNTYSRMGAIASAVAVFFPLSFALKPYLSSTPKRKVIGSALVIGAAVVIITLSPIRLRNRIDHASTLDKQSTALRLAFWKDCRPFLADHLAFGSGLGTFESVYPRYQTGGLTYRVEYAHNDYLQLLVEIGLPAFLTSLFVLGMALRVLWRAGLARGEANHSICLACLGAVLAILLHSLVDFNLQIPANAMTFAWVLGIGCGAGTSPYQRSLQS